MTRVWTEGFEMKDLVGYVTSSGFIDTSIKRSGNASLLLPRNGGWDSFTKSITGVSEFYLRLGVYSTGWGQEYVYWRSGTNNIGYVQCNNSGNIYININGLTATGTTVLLLNTWYLIEIHVKIDDAVGVVEVRLEGIDEVSVSGDTKGAYATADNIYFYHGDPDWYIDDIALNDTAGAVDNSWCGDGKIIVVLPNGDTATLQLTPSAAGTHYTLVDEVPADGDTTYVEGSVVNEEDLYDLAACGLTDVIIKRIWAEARAKDTVASGGTIALVTKAAGGADVVGADVSLLTTYTVKVLSAEQLVNPVDSAAWEVADIDALQGGPRTRS